MRAKTLVVLILAAAVAAAQQEPQKLMCECVPVATPTPEPTPAPTPTPIPPAPELAKFDANMLTTANTQCGVINNPAVVPDAKLGQYDGTRTFLFVYQRTQDPRWLECARVAYHWYGVNYVLKNGGGVPGYWNFSDGLRLLYEIDNNAQARELVGLLYAKAAYAGVATPLVNTRNVERSREVALAINTALNAQALGFPDNGRLAVLVDHALGHIDQWFVAKSYRGSAELAGLVPEAVGQYYVQPFMVGLTVESLARAWEVYRDPRIPPAVKIALDWLRANAWVAADEAFWYQNWVADPSLAFPAKAGSPDVGNLIAPGFAWYAKVSGDQQYRVWADESFAGTVKKGWLGNYKHFNQAYWLADDYLKWRVEVPQP